MWSALNYKCGALVFFIWPFFGCDLFFVTVLWFSEHRHHGTDDGDCAGTLPCYSR